MGAPKAHLRELAAHSKDHHHGVLRVLAPPLRTGHGRGVSGAEPGELQELRIFASPDGVRFGKQVGGGARFELRLPAPERPILASGSLEPTSLQLLWEAPAGAQGANGRGSLEDAYVLRGRPTGLRLEETLPVAGLKSAAVWSHARQDITRFHCHEVQNLVPGLVYQFEVALLRRAVPAEPPPAGGEEGEAAAAVGAHATPRGSPEAPPSTFGGQLSVSPSPRRGSSLSLSPSPRPSPPLRRGSSASLSGASCSPREVPGGRRPGGLESLPSPALEVAMPARRVPPAPGRPELAERRPGGELLLRWVADAQAMRPAIDITSPGKTATRLELPADAGEEVPTRFGALPPPAALVGQTGAVEFELLWDLAPEVAGGTCRAGAGASVDLGGSTFWPCTAPCWHRRLEDDRVECLVQLPAVEAPGGAARFCVRARDILGGEATEVLGDVGQAVALPTEAEVVLRDAGGLRALGRAAAAAGGLHRLLEAMEDAGVSQAGSSVQQRGLLMAKVDEAGGLEAFNGALEGVHMPAFAKSSKAVRRICSAETPEDRSGAWDAVTRLVEDGGGAVAVAHGLDGLDMPELVAVGPGLASLGLLRAKGGERPGLLRDRKQAAAVAALARSLEGEAASPERLRELGGAVVAMARSGSSGESWVGLARAAEHVAGGPSLGAELLSYAGKGARELAKATQAAQTDAKSLSEFLHHARAAEFLGPSADHWARQDFLARVEAAGGAPVLYRALEGMDLKTLRPAMEVVRTAGLHHISCLSHGVGEPSRAELWLQLASAVEHEWGGVAAAIGYKRNEAAKHRAAASTHAETDALLRLAERSGGVAAATRLLDQAAFAGGADRLLEDFGAAADLGRAAAVVARVRRGGGGLEDLERAVDVANDAGGMARFVRALQKTDATRLGELLEHGAALDKTLRGPVPPANRGTAEECTALLGRILADMPPSSFLQAFAAVRLPTLARLAPLLAPAGLLRKRGHPGSEDEIMAAAEAFLRWLALAGGVQRMGLAVGLVEPRAFVHIMDLVRVSGLTALPVGSFRKVASWLANVGGGSRQPSGDLASGLEALVDATQGVDLPRLVSLLWRVGAMAGVDTGHSEVLAAPPQPSTPERAARAQEMLEALAALAAGCGGSARLLQLHGRVDHIRRLEHALELLAEAGLLRASSSSAPSPSPEQLRAAFRPWVTVLQLVRAVGGVEAFHGRAEALRQPYLEELFEVLRAAGLVGPAYAVLGEDRPGGGAELRHDIAEWHRVVSLVADGGGPGLFLRSLEGVDVRDILHTVGHLRRAGLARGARDSPRSREDSFEYADGGEAEGRVRCSLLRCFAEKVVEAGGFHVFWHVLRRVDLARLQADLHCLEVVRRKLCESSQEDLWQLVASPERLEALLGSLDGRGPREDELTPKQRERLTRKLRSAGGVDAFLENFNDVDLACAAPQLRALEENGLSSPQAIAGLARIGKVVHFKDAHLNGLQQVVATLWQWGIAHYGSAEPDALWEGLNQQVAWLLTAMEANTSLVRTSRPASRTKRELELTPARLAQFLQVLRPIGGVQGFLAAFRGLDLANAAAQARILADASVRTVDTARRLAGLYRLLHGDPSHLRGLEQFVRSFCAPVLVDAPGDKLRASERWQRLTESLAAAAGKAPAPALAEEGKGEVLGETLRPEATSAVFSGPDRALDVVALGIRLADAAGIAARPEDWAELCGELRANEGGLAPLLARLRAGSPRSQPMANRTAIRQRSATTRPRNLECRRCGARMDYHVSRSKSSSALFG